MHILYDPDGSEFKFNVGGSVQHYLEKGFTVKPPSKAAAKAVRDAKLEKDKVAAAKTAAAQEKINDENELKRRAELEAQEGRLAKILAARKSAAK